MPHLLRGLQRLRSWAPTNRGVVLPLLVLVVSIQVVTGAYHTERGLYSDESAHFMNGLVLRDYAYSGFSMDPLSFARDYYQHYPKIAPLMWPPLFHGLLGVWLLPGWPPQPAAIALLGMFAAWTAWRLYTMVSTFAPIPVALAAAGFFVATPAVVSLSGSVMVDIVVAAFALESTYWLSRYFTTLDRRDAIIFGLMAACGCLAKGNGVAIVLVPICLIALTGRYNILRQSGLYLAAAIIVVIAVPLLTVTVFLDTALGDFDSLTFALITGRIVSYSGYLSTQIGVAPLALAALGFGASMTALLTPSSAAAVQARGLAALVVAGWTFHLFTPNGVSPDQRYLTLIFAPLYGLAGLGVMTACRSIRPVMWRWTAQLLIFGVVTASHFLALPALSAEVPLGYGAATEYLGAGRLAGSRILVISDELGEGAFVVELATMGLKPRPMAIRGSKLLASDDWMGRNFTLRFDSSASILAELEAIHVDFIVLDSSAEAQRLAYWSLAHDLVTSRPDDVAFIYHQPVDASRGPLRPLALYQVLNRTAGPPKSPSVRPGISEVFKILK